MSLNYSRPDQALVGKAQEKLRKMLFHKAFLERWESVQTETKWVITGCPDEKHHQKILPDYCYKILELQKRTIYKLMSPVSEVIRFKNKSRALKAKTIADAKKVMSIDWEKLGAVFSLGERCQTFFEKEVETFIKRDGLTKLKKRHEAELYRMMFGNTWLEKKLAEIRARNAGKLVEEAIENEFAKLKNTTQKAVAEWHEKAREWDVKAVTNYHTGVVKGSSGFIDKDGELKGEKKIKLRNTYEILLLAWPEIDEMLKADPPKTRNQLWDWLKTFSHVYWIEIQDLEQLNRLCTEIKLKLKKPGAPRKTK
jgi:hypothetical protein